MESSVGKEVVDALEEFMGRVFPDIVGASWLGVMVYQ